MTTLPSLHPENPKVVLTSGQKSLVQEMYWNEAMKIIGQLESFPNWAALSLTISELTRYNTIMASNDGLFTQQAAA